MTPYWQQGGLTIYNGDVRAVLAGLADESVQMCVTSPPYWALRDYGTGKWEGGSSECDHLGKPVPTRAGFNERYFGRASVDGNKQDALREPYKEVCGKCGARRIDQQLGLEPTPEAFIETMVEVFRDVRRVLRTDGTLWCNMGGGYVDKQLDGIPWRLALALQADGWWLRSDIIWHKPNPMPESVTDRPTKSHEYIFLLTKAGSYFYDAEAVREAWADSRNGDPGAAQTAITDSLAAGHARYMGETRPRVSGRNLRDVWTVPTFSFPGAHFATFPPKLIEPCIRAGTSMKGCCAKCGAPRKRIVESDRKPTRPGRDNVSDETGLANRDEQRHVTEYKTTGWQDTCECKAESVPCTVLDPFSGSATTLLVARNEGCRGIGIELNREYCDMAKQRLAQDCFDFVGPACPAG